jgi:hypothetical protein
MIFLQLIEDYLNAVEQCLDLFEDRFGRRDLMIAFREGVFSRTGELKEGVEYSIHGIGCRVLFADDLMVDFDYASELEIGFDAWRLWLYAGHFPKRYAGFLELEAVELAFHRVAAEGKIVPFEPNGRLHRLTTGT